ncbi:MAG: molybdopterin molybdotransferase MoeA [Wenzhouxiangellaceae bacterium]|nr:molybdopterin molybdotransferase MoeA [Wenzhouxiangellaceae bacterium]
MEQATEPTGGSRSNRAGDDPGDCCGGGHDSPALSLEQARERILDAVSPVAGSERMPLMQALGRVLSEPVIAGMDVPAHTNSAMDGYALRSADVATAGIRLQQVGTSFAGRPFSGSVAAGQCVRIMTGAVMPDGADSVVMQERTRVEGEFVVFDQAPASGANVRPAGEDIARGDQVLEPGRWLTAADLGLLASLGFAEVSVRQRPRVAFFSTGDELRPVGQALGAGQIHDSNRYTLFGLLTELGMDLLDLGIVEDTPEALSGALNKAADCDAVITTGGVSVGDADYVLEALEKAGSVGFWQVAMKPGRPLAFGRIGQALFFGLPGNPVSAMVTFMQLARPALVKLAGSRPAEPLCMRLAATEAIRKKPGRREFQRGRLSFVDGNLVVEPLGHQGSGVLRSMSRADCFINLGPTEGRVEAGDLVTVEPFAQAIWNGEQRSIE